LNSGRGKRFVCSPKCPDQFRGPLGPLLGGYLVYFLGIKALGHDVNHPPPPRAELKDERNGASTAHRNLHGLDRDDFTCYS